MRIKVGTINLQVREYKNVGDAILFLHFGGSNLMMWQRAIPYFEERYHLILADLRGHGKSDKPRTGYHIDEMASDIIGIMDYLGIEEAHVIGSSIGAEIGLSLAADYPEKIKSLSCEGALYSEFGPYGLWEGTESAFKDYTQKRMKKMKEISPQVFPSIDAFVDERKKVFEKYGWWNEYIEAVERYDAFNVEEGQYTQSWGKKAREDYTKHYFEYRFEEYYKRVKCPLLMLPDEGMLENERAKEVMTGLRDLSVQGQIAEISGWVHPYGWLLGADKMSERILSFLEELK